MGTEEVTTEEAESTDELVDIFSSNETAEEEETKETEENSDDEDNKSEEDGEKEEEEEEEKESSESETEQDEAGKEEEEEETESKEEDGDTEEAGEEQILSVIQEENQELRSSMRAMKQELALLKAKTVETEEDDEGNRIPTEVEKLSDDLKKTLKEKASIFNLQPMMMRNTEEYKDIDDVCSSANWDVIIDAAAEGISKEQGIDAVEARLQVENFVWNQDNPYEFMYKTIKEHHPNYQKETGGESKGKQKVAKQSKKAPGSVAKMSSSTTKGNGWTREKIDNLPEHELSKVPSEVYKKYMRNELD